MAGYTRNDTGNNIADGNVINASDLDGEFDAVEAAFNASTGHTHDGTSAEGAPIEKVGPVQDLIITATEVKPKTDNTLDLGTSLLEFKDLYLDGTANIDSLVADTADINAGTIDGVTIGGATPAAGTFTTLTANGNVVLGDAATDTVTITADVASNVIPSADNTYDLGASGSEWKDLYIDGTANIDSLVADTADINGGSIDGATLGTNSAVTEAQIDNININGNTISSTDTNGNIAITPDGTGEVDISKVDIDGGAIDGTTIGGSSAAAGSFTTLNTSGAVVFNDAGADVDFRVEGNTDANLLFVDAGNDRVGIGTSSPESPLNVYHATENNIATLHSGDTNCFITFRDNTTTNDGYVFVGAEGNNLKLGAGATTRAVIDSSGNVGIGTTSPHSLFGSGNTLHISGATGGGLRLAETNNTVNSDLYSASTGLTVRTQTNHPMLFLTNNSERMRIDSSGNVGIGTSSPSQKLEVNGSILTPNTVYAITVAGENDTNTFIRFEGSDVMAFRTGNTERMRIDSSGNVGIGTSSPSMRLDLGQANPTRGIFQRIYNTTAGGTQTGAQIQFTQDSRADWVIGQPAATDAFAFWSGRNPSADGTERMRIHSNGAVSISTTASGVSNSGGVNTGHWFNANSYAVTSVNSGVCLYLNRQTDDGDVLVFRQDGTTVGSIGAFAGHLSLGNTDTGLLFNDTIKSIYPFNLSTLSNNDNAIDLGYSAARFDDIYATNGTIQTSDRNEKQDIETLSEAEQRVAVAAKALMRKFRWKDAVAEKGDDARIHFGIIAQDLQAAFEAEGLDAGRYAMFISNTWWETQTEVPAVEGKDAVLDEEGNVIEEAVEAKEAYTRTDTYDTAEEAPEGAVERTRLGVRYPELLAFIISAI